MKNMNCYLLGGNDSTFIVFICISLITSQIDDLYICSLTVSSFAGCLFISLDRFFSVEFFYFSLLILRSCLYILVVNPLSEIWLANIFSVFSLFLCLFSLLCRTFLSLMQSHLSLFAFGAYAIGIVYKKSQTNPGSQSFHPLFLLGVSS